MFDLENLLWILSPLYFRGLTISLPLWENVLGSKTNSVGSIFYNYYQANTNCNRLFRGPLYFQIKYICRNPIWRSCSRKAQPEVHYQQSTKNQTFKNGWCNLLLLKMGFSYAVKLGHIKARWLLRKLTCCVGGLISLDHAAHPLPKKEKKSWKKFGSF